MKLFYLEWSDKFVKSKDYCDRPDESLTVSVMNDQSSFASNEFPSLTHVSDEFNKTIPGSFLQEFFESLQADYDQFDEIWEAEWIDGEFENYDF
jgi:hypothetical protein